MKQTTKAYIKSIINIILAVITVVLFITVVPRLLSFFMPFVVGWIIALIASPIVRFLEERLKIKRKAGTAVVIVVVIALIIVLGYFLSAFLIEQITGLMNDLPFMWESLQKEMNSMEGTLGAFFAGMPGELQSGWSNLIGSMEIYLSSLLTGGNAPDMRWIGDMAQKVPNIFVGTVMGFLSSYFFTAERSGMHNFLQDYMPKGILKYWNMVKKSFSSAVGGYFKAQFKIEGIIYVLLAIGLMILKIKYAPLIAVLVAIVDLLPVFGAGTILLPWAAFRFFGGDYKTTIGLLIIWGVAQVVRQMIQPKIVGDTLGMPAIPTLFLLFIGYKAAGVLGMILAVPIGIILLNMYQSGVFDTVVNSVRILCNGLNSFRRLTKEDLKLSIEKEEEKEL